MMNLLADHETSAPDECLVERIMNLLVDHETSAPDEYLVERMRLHRDALLVESDWAMIADTPTDKTVWAAYRQQLRDFPATWTPAPTVNFPEKP